MPIGDTILNDPSPRGIKRVSPSHESSFPPQKAPRTAYSGANVALHEKIQKEQLRLNKLQEEEKSREWVAQEDEFVLKQMKKKAAIRVKDRRARPIDWIALVVHMRDPTRTSLDDELDPVEARPLDPNMVIDKSSAEQVVELEGEIDEFLRLEKDPTSRNYWRMMKTLCLDRRRKGTANPADRTVGSVISDIDRLLRPKSYEELEALEHQIDRKLESNEPIDSDYWENLRRNLLVWKAKARLKQIYESVLTLQRAAHSKLDKTEEDLVKNREAKSRPGNFTTAAASSGLMHSSQIKSQERNEENSKKVDRSSDAAAPLGRFAPAPNEDFSQATRALYEKEVARGIADNEEVFAGEEDVDTKAKALWSGKYRPRKPRYFNRVQTGYEWNKYNQTHYDHDNPPPKVVQGYKFNVFYPDLIDKSKAPTYKIEREGGRKRGQSFARAGEEDTCLIRFMSGPPYEDIAFRIVDKEWDYSAKRERGFRSSFDKGILQLHFQFKKVFYRK